jgi:hypothetical protein
MKEKLIPQTIKDFNCFIRRAKAIFPEARSRLPVAEFNSFSREANRLAIQQVRNALGDPLYRDHLKKLCRWIIPFGLDILARAGISGLENSYTNLIAWMLFPPGRPDQALRCQRAWLKAMGLAAAEVIAKPAEPLLYSETDDGIPDMVLHFQNPAYVIIVEAKLGSIEHTAPNSRAQTIAYPFAVRRALELSDDYPGDIVFLTRDGAPAKNPAAVNTTYDMLVDAIASELSPEELSSDVRWAYSMIITHLLANAASGNIDRAEHLRKIADWLGRRQGSFTDEDIILEIRTLGPICRAINLGA